MASLVLFIVAGMPSLVLSSGAPDPQRILYSLATDPYSAKAVTFMYTNNQSLTVLTVSVISIILTMWRTMAIASK